MHYIGVIGSSSCTTEEKITAFETGKEIAERDRVLICGGLGGVMEEASRGCYKEGGTVIGILPGNKRSEANPYVTYALPTGLGEVRNFLVVRSSDVLIAIAGGYGTLSEIAIALKENKHVITIGTRFDVPGTITASSPVEAVKKALEV